MNWGLVILTIVEEDAGKTLCVDDAFKHCFASGYFPNSEIARVIYYQSVCFLLDNLRKTHLMLPNWAYYDILAMSRVKRVEPGELQATS